MILFQKIVIIIQIKLNKNVKRGKQMPEKEKRDKQELYDGNYNLELIEEMKKAKDLCFEYNNIQPSKKRRKRKINKENFG